jgi:diguanylate cyclase (GGDEF)-like protein
MNKSNAKKILEEIYIDAIAKVDASEGMVSKYDLVSTLQNTLSSVAMLDLEAPNALDVLHASLEDQFKHIALDTISSYDNSNKRMGELIGVQEETISNFDMPSININDIKNKFENIQTHMLDEVNKANSMIVGLTKKIEDLEKSSLIDHLTKTYNRNALSSDLLKLCSLENINDDIHLFVIDIDNFKSINDTYGHVVGDKVLIFLANILRKTLREGVKIYRYGGEEFIVLLNRIEKKESHQIAQRIVSLINSNRLIYKELNINITVSLGATTLRIGDTPDELITRADKALYIAKQNGKNRVEIAQGDIE